MLQLAGRVGLGMDVGDLFEFQRTFEGHGKLRAATEEQGMALVGEALREFLNLIVENQGLFDLRRQTGELLHQFDLGLGGQAVATAQHHHQHQQGHQLGGERLGGGHTDLRTGAGHQYQIALAHQ